MGEVADEVVEEVSVVIKAVRRALGAGRRGASIGREFASLDNDRDLTSMAKHSIMLLPIERFWYTCSVMC